jgi:hypothetical protein
VTLDSAATHRPAFNQNASVEFFTVRPRAPNLLPGEAICGSRVTRQLDNPNRIAADLSGREIPEL